MDQSRAPHRGKRGSIIERSEITRSSCRLSPTGGAKFLFGILNIMKPTLALAVLIIIALAGFSYFVFFAKKQTAFVQNPLPITTPTPTAQEITSPTPTIFPDTQSAVAAFLANKYQKPVSEVHVTVDKEVPGFASGTVSFGQGGPGEVGAWLAYLGNGWNVAWDGNGNVDCNKMRQDYGFPDTILKPNFCN